MATLNGQSVLPGAYSRQAQTSTPLLPAGTRIPAIIGTVIPTISVSGETVTRSALAYDLVLHNPALSLGATITDANQAIYKLNTDYQLGTGSPSPSGSVDWSLTAAAFLTGTTSDPFSGLVLNASPWTGTTFSISVVTNPLESSPSTVTYSYSFVPADFASPSAALATEVATALTGNHALTGTLSLQNGMTAVVGTTTSFTTQLVVGSVITDTSQPTFFATVASITDNTHLTLTANWTGATNTTATVDRVGFPSSGAIAVTASSHHVVLTTTSTKNAELIINNGTANTILGFVGGSSQFTPQEPATGVTYTVSYTYNKPTAAYNPFFAFSMNDVLNYAGPLAVDSGNNPLWTLAVAAQIAFANGAPAIYLQGLNAADGAVLTQFTNALTKLQAVGCNIVVPITDGNVATPISPGTAVAVWSATQAHVDFMSSTTERMERTGYVGTYATDVPTNITQATALDDKRMLFVYNNQPTYFVGTSTTASILDGSYLAAAISGIRTSTKFDVATPLDHKLVTGFASIPDILLTSQKTLLVANGVCVIGTVSGSSLVLQGTTTNVSTVDNSEIAVVEAADYVIQSSRTILEAIFTGQKGLPNTPSLVASVQTSILTQLTNQQIINGLVGSVTAVYDSGNPSQIDVSFTYNAVYSVQVIFITYSLAL